MQRGFMQRVCRKRGPDMWQFRWSETDPDGKRAHRKKIVGTVEQYADEHSARRAVVGLIAEINTDFRLPNSRTITVAELCDHFEQRELADQNNWRSHATKKIYKAYLNRWVRPHWQRYPLPEVIDFDQRAMSVTRSIVYGVVGPCKTESSQKPVPLHSSVAECLMEWKRHSAYTKSEDWLFASRWERGRKPIQGQAVLRKHIRPVAERMGIQKQFGWHTFRHTYSTLLRSVGTEFKVMQELLRHSTLRSTLDIYTQAMSPAKHEAQAAVLSLVFSSDAGGAFLAGQEAAVR